MNYLIFPIARTMNVNRLWKQRIERDLNSQIVDEDFLKLLTEYESNSKITRKRARDISRKLIGVYPDQVTEMGFIVLHK